MSKYENNEICAKCGGLCCKSGGCIISPDQFKEFNLDVLRTLINTGIVVMDWWEGDPIDTFDTFDKGITGVEKEIIENVIKCNPDAIEVDENGMYYSKVTAYYLRIREDSDPDNAFEHASWGGHCILHQKYGICPIDINHRPYEAAYMIPNPDRIHPNIEVRFKATCHGDEIADKYSKMHISTMYMKYSDIFADFREEMYGDDDNAYIFEKCDKDFSKMFKGEESINTFKSLIKYTDI